VPTARMAVPLFQRYSPLFAGVSAGGIGSPEEHIALADRHALVADVLQFPEAG